MNIEVEIKVKVKDFKELELKIKRLGKLKKELHQVDDYYTPVHRDFFKQDPPEEFLRIRTDTKTSFEYHVAKRTNGEKTHAEEYELGINDEEMLKKILNFLDIKKKITVDKQRKVYECGNFEICLDYVKNLGHFLEIEAKKDFGGVENTKKECEKFLQNLNIEYQEVPDLGYPNLVLRGWK